MAVIDLTPVTITENLLDISLSSNLAITSPVGWEVISDSNTTAPLNPTLTFVGDPNYIGTFIT